MALLALAIYCTFCALMCPCCSSKPKLFLVTFQNLSPFGDNFIISVRACVRVCVRVCCVSVCECVHASVRLRLCLFTFPIFNAVRSFSCLSSTNAYPVQDNCTSKVKSPSSTPSPPPTLRPSPSSTSVLSYLHPLINYWALWPPYLPNLHYVWLQRIMDRDNPSHSHCIWAIFAVYPLNTVCCRL